VLRDANAIESTTSAQLSIPCYVSRKHGAFDAARKQASL